MAAKNQCAYKIYQVVNKLLLEGDKFLPEMHLSQPGFNSACGLFTRNKEFKNLC